MTLTLESLQDLFEATQAGLTHAVQRESASALSEVGRSVRAGGAENVRFTEHVLHHEVGALRRTRDDHPSLPHFNKSWSDAGLSS